MHPEVNISLLTLLYAGKTLLNINIIKDIKNMLKLKSKSAGNKLYKFGTSETLCNEINNFYISENILNISIHVPTHRKPSNSNDFSYYLAGLIDGNGYIKDSELIILFHKLDSSLAYYIKSKLGYGSVKSYNNSIILIISNKKGLDSIFHLINGKIKTLNIYNQFLPLYSNLKLGNINDFNNNWLAGFIDILGSFHIEILNKKEIKLNFQLKFNDLLILNSIKSFLGGNINSNNIYNSTNLSSAYNIINYLNKYHLLSNKHINYLKWRKTYILLQNKEYLNINGINKIIKYKNTINKWF